MFDSIGWGEVLVVALAALFIFGPERLPVVAKDVARALARIRATVSEIRTNVDETLGEDLAPLRDLDLRRYHPQTFVRDHILGDSHVGDPPSPGGVAADRAAPPE
jgi:sec-independent protein translocase protein TatB